MADELGNAKRSAIAAHIMQIVWSDKALSDLERIRAYIKQFNPYAASALAKRIADSIKTLADFPYKGRQGRVFGTRELVITNTSYNAVFSITNDTVEILTIIHQAQDWENS